VRSRARRMMRRRSRPIVSRWLSRLGQRKSPWTNGKDTKSREPSTTLLGDLLREAVQALGSKGTPGV